MRRFPGRAYYYTDYDTFYAVTNLDSLRSSPEIHDLEQAGQFVRHNRASGYRLVLLPYRETGTFVDTGTTRCGTFREVSYELVRGRTRLADHLPAIAVFMPGDPRGYPPLFEHMRERRDYVSDGCRFTILFSADNGRSVIYDVRMARESDSGTAR